MENQQPLLWRRMIELIDCYRDGRIRFSRLVGELEGMMDASDLREKEVVEQWYDLWQPLEIRNATHGDRVKKDDVAVELDAMESFIRRYL